MLSYQAFIKHPVSTSQCSSSFRQVEKGGWIIGNFMGVESEDGTGGFLTPVSIRAYFRARVLGQATSGKDRYWVGLPHMLHLVFC